MTERAPQQPSRLEILRRSGIPERLLEQMGENGIQHDYRNKWFWPLVAIGSYNPHSPTNNLADAAAPTAIRKAIRASISYSDYWKIRLARYNDNERGDKLPVLEDLNGAFDILVTQQPGARRLDLLAEQAQALADSDLDPATLVRSYIQVSAQVHYLLYGKKDALSLLRDYGLLEKRPGK